jgi:hypothetical protein
VSNYDNTNRFVLYITERKREGKDDPDRTGTLNIEGREYYLDGWLRKGRDGRQFLSGTVKPKHERNPGPRARCRWRRDSAVVRNEKTRPPQERGRVQK